MLLAGCGADIHTAARQGDASQVQALLRSGVAADTRDEYGRTPLYYAHGLAVTKLLVDHGANVNREFRDISPGGFPPLAMAQDAPSLLYMLDHGGGNLNLSACGMQGIPLLLAVQWGDLALVKTLVARGARLNWDGYSPALAEATEFGNLAIFQYLLSQGATVKGTEPDSQENLLHKAAGCYADNTTIARLLLDKGVPLNARDQEGQTPLHVAVLTNSTMVRFLVENGADMDAKDNYHERPVDRARRLHGMSVATARSAQYLSAPRKRPHH